MGFFSTVGGLIGRGVGAVGNVIKKVGSIGMEAARRVGEFASPLANSVAGIVGNNPVGNFIKGVGQKVGNFANTTGQAIARGISDVGNSVGGIANALKGGGG